MEKLRKHRFSGWKSSFAAGWRKVRLPGKGRGTSTSPFGGEDLGDIPVAKKKSGAEEQGIEFQKKTGTHAYPHSPLVSPVRISEEVLRQKKWQLGHRRTKAQRSPPP